MDAETSSVLLERLKKQKEERMTFNPETHHRHSIRLTHYDYSQPGYYFITLCTRDKECLFIDVENNHLVLNEIGRVVNKIWNNLPGHFSGIELDKMVIMPNHLHGIIVITDCRGGVIPPFGVFPPNKIIPPISNERAREPRPYNMEKHWVK